MAGTFGEHIAERIPHRSCAIINSGTSRFLVLHEEELPTGNERSKIILDLLAKSVPTEGMGGLHYQANKVAVVGTGNDGRSFVFHFYQVMPQSRRLLSKMECSNAASSSGLAAMLLGSIHRTHDGSLTSINLATNQNVDLIPPRGAFWEGDWGVRFTNLHHLWAHMTTAAEPFEFTHDRIAVHGSIVKHGNVFVMTELPVAKASPELVETLSRRGERFAHHHGHMDTMPKVFIYDIRKKADREMHCDAVCFSEGQQHHSLPGSGAMALGAFLTTQGHLTLPEHKSNAETIFHFTHPSGSLIARVHLVRGASDWQIDSTSFDTPVRLLMYGNLISR